MIPSFPKFKKFQVKDIDDVKRFTNNFPAFGEYSVVRMLTWNKTEVSDLNGNIVIKLSGIYEDNTPAYSILGINKIEESIFNLLQITGKRKIDHELILVPEPVIQEIKSTENFIIEEDRDMFDYILSTEELYRLRGNRNMSKRGEINIFKRNNPNYSIKELNTNERKIIADITFVFNTWTEFKDKSKIFFNNEYDATIKILKYSKELNVLAFGIYIEYSLIGYSIIELIDNSYAIYHYNKWNRHYKGVTTMLSKHIGEYLYNKRYLYLNIEGDLGIPGLRQAKQLLHPVHLLKKYTIRLNE